MSVERFPDFFASVPPLALRDPLAEFLGAVPAGEPLVYTFADAVRAAGHVCPTVAGGWVVTAAALAALYPGETPIRGEIEVRCMGAPEQFGYGPMAQVIGFLTGAATETGFRGLGGKFRRAELLTFHPESPALATFEFRRVDSGAAVRVAYDAGRVPPAPGLREVMEGAMHGDAEAGAAFRQLWLERVERLLARAADVIDVVPLAGRGAGDGGSAAGIPVQQPARTNS